MCIKSAHHPAPPSLWGASTPVLAPKPHSFVCASTIRGPVEAVVPALAGCTGHMSPCRPSAARGTLKVIARKVQPPSPQKQRPQVQQVRQQLQQQEEELGPGSRIVLSGRCFRVLGPLGQGSFGTVWAAQDEKGITVAVKQIPCRSESEIAKVMAEGHVLESVGRELSQLGSAADGHFPVLVASEVTQTEQSRWQVRLAMSLVPGMPLESFLGARYLKEKEQCADVAAWAEEPCEFRLALACQYAGELLLQLSPIVNAFSSRIFHRDITPRNILVQAKQSDGEEEGQRPRFGLVDFGLAVDASKWRAEEGSASDLGGDGRYWPASCWFVFSHGRGALEQEPELRKEYRSGLDTHSLGLSTLQCLVEMLPRHLPEGAVPEFGEEAWLKLQELCTAWEHYWSDARGFWQPVYNAFRSSGDFEALREAYSRAAVHDIISNDLGMLRAAMREAHRACESSPMEMGLAGMPSLLDALLVMVHDGRPDDEPQALPVCWHLEELLRSPVCSHRALHMLEQEITGTDVQRVPTDAQSWSDGDQELHPWPSASTATGEGSARSSWVSSDSSATEVSA